MKLKLVGLNGDPDPVVEQYLAAEEIGELDALAADASVIGLHVMTRDGAVVRSEGIWAELAPPVFANVMRLAARIGEEFGEGSRHIIAFAENDDLEVAVVPLSQTDAVVIRRRAQAVGLSNVR
ncbi:MAG: hypothetical protein AAFP78_13385 [Pseudomonadota bacterium]